MMWHRRRCLRYPNVSKESQRAEEERIRQEFSFLFNPENAFDRIGTQFSAISNTLSEMGFYDRLSDDETFQVECLLAEITYGMDSISVGGNLAEENPACGQLSSYAARFELESSTAALRQFSEKFVPEDMQETLNALASGNSKNQSLLQYVSQWNSFSIENARHYWNLLV